MYTFLSESPDLPMSPTIHTDWGISDMNGGDGDFDSQNVLCQISPSMLSHTLHIDRCINDL